MVVAQVHDRELDWLVIGGEQRNIASVDLEAEEVEELDKRLTSLHALVGEGDERVS